MGAIKTQVAKVKNNIPGAIVGGAALYFAAKKFGGVQNKWALIGLGVAGLFIGANIQSAIKAKNAAPTASTATTPPATK